MSIIKITSPRTGKVSFAAVVSYRDEDGKRKQVRRSARTRNEAKSLEAGLIRGRDEGTVQLSDRLQFGAYLGQWLGQQGQLRQSTRSAYAYHIRLADGLASLPVTKVTPIHLMKLYATLRESGRSEKTGLNTHRVLRRALKDAVRWGLVSRNVCDLVDAPKAGKFEHHVITVDELRALYSAADDTELGTLVRLAAWTGLRLGELTALTWTDIDFDTSVLTVRQAFDKSGLLSIPKTEKSKRRLTLSPETMRLLAAQAVGIDTGSRAFVFRRPGTDNPYTHSAVEYGWNRLRVKAGVPRARWHDLRHAHATHLLSAGWPLALVAARLGHTTVTTTLNTYSHALPGMDVELAAAIDGILT